MKKRQKIIFSRQCRRSLQHSGNPPFFLVFFLLFSLDFIFFLRQIGNIKTLEKQRTNYENRTNKSLRAECRADRKN